MQENIKQVELNNFYNKEKSLVSKLLPWLLFVSFIWLNLYTNFTTINSPFLSFSPYENGVMFFSILFAGFFQYLIFEILLFVYRFCLGFSIYSFMIPKQVIKDKFRLWYLFRNVFLGIIFNLRFFFPYITSFLFLFELVLNFVFVIAMYFDLSKSYVEPLVGQFVFKSMAVPVFLYETLRVILFVVGAL